MDAVRSVYGNRAFPTLDFLQRSGWEARLDTTGIELDQAQPSAWGKASVPTRIDGPDFGGKVYELSVCFIFGLCLTPKKVVW